MKERVKVNEKVAGELEKVKNCCWQLWYIVTVFCKKMS